MQRLAASVVCLLLASAPACAEDEYTQNIPGYSKPLPSTEVPDGSHVDRSGVSLPSIIDTPRNLYSMPPLGDRQTFHAPSRMDRSSYKLVLLNPTTTLPLLVRFDVKPGYSTFNRDYLSSNNAFGNKARLSFIARPAPHVNAGLFLTIESELEQFSRMWRPSSQAGAASFLTYEVAPGLHLGVEARVWRSYAHLYATRPLSWEAYAGPRLTWNFAEDATLEVAFAPKIAGAKGPKTAGVRPSRFDTDVFENHPLRLRLTFGF